MSARLSRHRSQHPLALLIVIAATAAGLALAAASLASAAVTVSPVCIVMGGQAGPDVCGPMAVWADARNGNLDIFGRNIVTGKTFSVTTNKAQQDNPSVGSRTTTDGKTEYVAVWVDHRNHADDDGTDIYARDLTTATTFAVARSATTKWFPDIAGDWVVWIEAGDSDTSYTVTAVDLATGTAYTVATTEVLSPPAVALRTTDAGEVTTVVWASGKGDISMRDLPDGTVTTVSAGDKFEWAPDISGNRVVWWESGGRVMLKNLTTGKKTFVHLGARPRIDGVYVTWDDGGHGGSYVVSYNAGADIYVRKVTSSRVTRISQPHLTCLFPAISGRRVVWEAGPAFRVLSHIHIYKAKIPE